MPKRQQKKRFGTIFMRTFCPIFVVLLLIICAYVVAMQETALSYLKTNATNSFSEQVHTRSIYLQNEMTNRWSAIYDSAQKITAQLEQDLAQQGIPLSQIQTDSALNQQLLANRMDDVLSTLYTCGATEIFLVLDGIGMPQQDAKQNKAGVFLRNGSPEQAGVTQSLLLERGLPAISKKWKLPLDTFWQAGFTIDPEDPNSDFFTKPIEAARSYDDRDPQNFAFWTYSRPVNPSDVSILSYSLPLIASDGTVLGVFGIGLSERYVAKSLDHQDLSNPGAYTLVKTTDGQQFEPLIFSSLVFHESAFLNKIFTLEKMEQKGTFYLRGNEQTAGNRCVSMEKLNMYSHNTPFEQEQWYIMGIQNEQDLFAVYDRARSTLLILAVGAILLSLIGVLITSRFTTNPIRRLVDNLRQSDPNRPIQLKRVDIEEVDELAVSIETLSERVAAAFSKLSTIIEMSESGIGVFEYKEDENLVFCSRSLYAMLGWTPVGDGATYTDGTAFVEQFQTLDQYRTAEEPDLLELPAEPTGKKWIRLTQIRDHGSLLGVLTDVTSTILEKQQIEYERDYDILTSIYNRRGFEDHAQALFSRPEKLKYAAFLMWDLDNLKFVNDSYGHTYGDAYIIAMADCLKHFASPHVLSARRSGDEFVTFIHGMDSEQEVAALVQHLWQQTEQAAITLPAGNEYKVRVSAGIARYPHDSTMINELFSYADFAMYIAKHNHKGTFAYFDPDLYAENKILLQGQEEFLDLIENHLVRYMLQPILSAKDGSIYGYEMLMRSTAGLFTSPADILRMAHAQFKLYDIEVMTWFEAMKTYVQMREYGMLAPNSKVFINSLSSQILKEDMVQLFCKTYEAYLSSIVCEFTEEYQRSAQLSLDKTTLFHSWNALIAIDDYGCGYNSESVLLEVSPDIVKIDMSIVRGIDTDQDRQYLVRNLIRYAKTRGILVLGEGVETKEEMQTLLSLGIDLLQGYYLAVPSFEAAPPAKEIVQQILDFQS